MEKIKRVRQRCSPMKKHVRILLLDGRFHMIYITSGESSPNLQNIPNLEKKKVWCCDNGWILISGEKVGKFCTMYDQFTMWKPECWKEIELPPLCLKPNQRINAAVKPNQRITAAVIVSSSESQEPGWTVLLLVLEDAGVGYLMSYRFGDAQWNQQRAGSELVGGDDTFFAHCNGNLYAATSQEGKVMVMKQNRVGRFSLASLDYGLPLPRTISAAHPYRVRNYMLDFRGQVYFVALVWGGIQWQEIIDAEVYKLEQAKWIKVTSLENGAAIFISDRHCAFSCTVNEPGIQGGCIYFCRDKDMRLGCFNIKLRRVTVSLPLRNLPESALLLIRDFRFPKPGTKITECCRETEEENASNVSELPLDILELISGKIDLFDYMNYRSVCTTFRTAAPNIKWRQVSSNKLSPWLMFPRHRDHPSYNLIDSHLGGLYTIKTPPDAKIRYSKDGWLLMSNHDSLFIYHPFLKITLPEEPIPIPKRGRHCFGYALSSLPPSQETILVMAGLDAIHYYCWQGPRVGWNEFRCSDYECFDKTDNVPIFFNGAFYFLSRQGKVGVFKLGRNGEASWETFGTLEQDYLLNIPQKKSPRPCCYSVRYNYLAECDGQLLSIFVEDDQSVHVYKLIFTSIFWGLDWEKVTCLGNYALFVSSSSSLSVISNSSDMNNRIYFPKFSGRCIVYYCLSTGKFYTTENNVVEDFYNTAEFLHSSWIQPWW